MKALVVTPPTPGVRLLDVDPPALGPGEVRVRILECGVCGTDRDIVAGLYGTPPTGRAGLVLGHENLGKVVEVGASVAGWSAGDLVVATVRRGCGSCRFCRANRSDFCETGRFTERGIRGRDGYLAEEYVDLPEYLVHVPPRLRDVAVLLEPLSVVEKAVHEGKAVLDRRGPTPEPPAGAPTALVAGTGAIGMLATFLLRWRGHEVVAVDRHGDDTPAARLLAQVGARHVNVASGLAALGDGRFEMVVEATGSPGLDLDLVRRLGSNGVLVLTGIPPANRPPIPVAAGDLLREMVLENQAIVGSVNANRSYFEGGLRDLARFRRRWGGAIAALITDRRPWTEYGLVLSAATSGAMKTVLTVGDSPPDAPLPSPLR